MLPAAAPPLCTALPPHGPWPAVLWRDGGARTAGGGCAGAGSGGAVSAGRRELEPGLRGWVRGCGTERRGGEDAGKRELCSGFPGPDPGAQAPCSEAQTRGTGPALDPELGVALSAGGTSEVWLAFVALIQVAQVTGAPLNEDLPLPPWCGGRLLLTAPFPGSSPPKWRRCLWSGGLAVTDGPGA